LKDRLLHLARITLFKKAYRASWGEGWGAFVEKEEEKRDRTPPQEEKTRVREGMERKDVFPGTIGLDCSIRLIMQGGGEAKRASRE